MRAFGFVVIFALNTLTPARAQDGGEEALAAALARLNSGEYQKAQALIAPLAARGDADAEHMLAYIYENGLGVGRDIARALELYESAALKGHADAQLALGELAFAGALVKRNYKYAAGWFRLAAARGRARAKFRLGVIYAEGLGVEPDKKRAVAYFEDASLAGDADSQFRLGVHYLGGEGVDEDAKEAARWFAAAAAQGHADAQFNLALLYDSPLMGAPDPEQSVKWMRAASHAGLPAALTAMGLFTHDGRLHDDGKSAADWFEEAALAGDAQGQFLYAVALAEGDDRDVDATAAAKWLDRVLAAPEALVDPRLRENAEQLRARLQQRDE